MGMLVKYCYDSDQVVAEYENGALKHKFIYNPPIDEPIIAIDMATIKRGKRVSVFY